VRREIFIDEILVLVAAKHMITTRDIQDIFTLDHRTTHKILGFLAKFDFIKLDRHYVTLSEMSKAFFDEIVAK
jgi:hypothetical protein